MIPVLNNRWVQFSLIAYVLSKVTLIGGELMQLDLISSKVITLEAANTNDTRIRLIVILSILVYIITTVFFSCWIVKAHNAVRALGATDMTITPGWAVGYFFIPFVNLVRPYTAMKELWRASINPSHPSSVKTSAILPLWWTLWILNTVVGNIAGRGGGDTKGMDALKNTTVLLIASALCSIFVGLVAMKLVHDITTNVQRLTSQPPSLPDNIPTLSPIQMSESFRQNPLNASDPTNARDA